MISDPEGSVLGVGQGGRSNYHNVGLPHALASLKSAFEDALGASGVRKERIQVQCCFGLAGLDSAKDMEAMTTGITSLRLGDGPGRKLVVNDWRAALKGAFVDDRGVTLIAGTGCVAAAQTPGGRKVVRVGGWGHVIDDRGSAYDIGKDALYAAMRDYDGRGPNTAILKLVMERLKVAEAQDIVARVYAEHMSVSRVASLSTLVAEAAKDGDAVARNILDAKGRILGELVVSAASALDMFGHSFGLSLNGGVFRAGKFVLGPMEAAIRRAAPMVRVVEPKLPPACGAVLLLLGKERKLTSNLISNMARSLDSVPGTRAS